jgi:hypothetical protein
VPPFRLRILRIFYFEPANAVAFVNAVFALRNNPFQIVVTDFFEQQLTFSFDVLSVDDSFWLVPLDQFS